MQKLLISCKRELIFDFRNRKIGSSEQVKNSRLSFSVSRDMTSSSFLFEIQKKTKYEIF